VADNGHTAVELAAQHRFDTVLMDIQMPVMEAMKQPFDRAIRLPDLPIIAMRPMPCPRIGSVAWKADERLRQ